MTVGWQEGWQDDEIKGKGLGTERVSASARVSELPLSRGRSEAQCGVDGTPQLGFVAG